MAIKRFRKHLSLSLAASLLIGAVAPSATYATTPSDTEIAAISEEVSTTYNYFDTTFPSQTGGDVQNLNSDEDAAQYWATQDEYDTYIEAANELLAQLWEIHADLQSLNTDFASTRQLANGIDYAEAQEELQDLIDEINNWFETDPAPPISALDGVDIEAGEAYIPLNDYNSIMAIVTEAEFLLENSTDTSDIDTTLGKTISGFSLAVPQTTYAELTGMLTTLGDEFTKIKAINVQGTGTLFTARENLRIALLIATAYLDPDEVVDNQLPDFTSDSDDHNTITVYDGDDALEDSGSEVTIVLASVSSTNGTDVVGSWVTQTVKDTFSSAVTTAQTIYDNNDGFTDDGDLDASETTDTTITTLEAALTTLSTAQATFVNSYQDGQLDAVWAEWANLQDAIRAAQETYGEFDDSDNSFDETMLTSEVNGTDVPQADKWVTPDELATIKDAVEIAKSVELSESQTARTTPVSTVQLQAATATLTTATTTFSNNIKDGIQEPYEDIRATLVASIGLARAEIGTDVDGVPQYDGNIVVSDVEGVDVATDWVTSEVFNTFRDLVLEAEDAHSGTDEKADYEYSVLELSTINENLLLAITNFKDDSTESKSDERDDLLDELQDYIDYINNEVVAEANVSSYATTYGGMDTVTKATGYATTYVDGDGATQTYQYVLTADMRALQTAATNAQTSHDTMETSGSASISAIQTVLDELEAAVEAFRAACDDVNVAKSLIYNDIYSGATYKAVDDGADGTVDLWVLDNANSTILDLGYYHMVNGIVDVDGSYILKPVQVSDSNGINIATTDYWVTSSIMTTFKAAITTAENVMDGNNTVAITENAKTTLTVAKDKFIPVLGTGEAFDLVTELAQYINYAKLLIGDEGYVGDLDSSGEPDIGRLTAPDAITIEDKYGSTVSETDKWITTAQANTFRGYITTAVNAYNSTSTTIATLTTAIETLKTRIETLENTTATAGQKEAFEAITTPFQELIDEAQLLLYGSATGTTMTLTVSTNNGTDVAQDTIWASINDRLTMYIALNNAKTAMTNQDNGTVTLANHQSSYNTFATALNSFRVIETAATETTPVVYASTSKVQYGTQGLSKANFAAAINAAQARVYETYYEYDETGAISDTASTSSTYVNISNISGNELGTDQEWVTSSVHSTYQTAIQTAIKYLGLITTSTPESTITLYTNILANATTTFENSVKYGTDTLTTAVTELNDMIAQAYRLIGETTTSGMADPDDTTTLPESGDIASTGIRRSLLFGTDVPESLNYVDNVYYTIFKNAITTAETAATNGAAKTVTAASINNSKTTLQNAINTIINASKAGTLTSFTNTKKELTDLIAEAQSLVANTVVNTNSGRDVAGWGLTDSSQEGPTGATYDSQSFWSTSVYITILNNAITTATNSSNYAYATVSSLESAIDTLQLAIYTFTGVNGSDNTVNGVTYAARRLPGEKDQLAYYASEITSLLAETSTGGIAMSTWAYNLKACSYGVGNLVSHDYYWVKSATDATYKTAIVSLIPSAYSNANLYNNIYKSSATNVAGSTMQESYEKLKYVWDTYGDGNGNTGVKAGTSEDTLLARIALRARITEATAILNATGESATFAGTQVNGKYYASSAAVLAFEQAIAAATADANNAYCSSIEYGYDITKKEAAGNTQGKDYVTPNYNAGTSIRTLEEAITAFENARGNTTYVQPYTIASFSLMSLSPETTTSQAITIE